MGSGNQVFSLLNIDPQVNADVNDLNTVRQEAVGGGAVVPVRK